MIKNLLNVVIIGTALCWLSQKGWIALQAPWHQYVPWAFWTALLARLVAVDERPANSVHVHTDKQILTIPPSSEQKEVKQ